MKSPKYYINLTENEKAEIIRLLIKLKNKLILQGKYTDAVDDVLIKKVKSKKKKFVVHFSIALSLSLFILPIVKFTPDLTLAEVLGALSTGTKTF